MAQFFLYFRLYLYRQHWGVYKHIQTTCHRCLVVKKSDKPVLFLQHTHASSHTCHLLYISTWSNGYIQVAYAFVHLHGRSNFEQLPALRWYLRYHQFELKVRGYFIRLNSLFFKKSFRCDKTITSPMLKQMWIPLRYFHYWSNCNSCSYFTYLINNYKIGR